MNQHSEGKVVADSPPEHGSPNGDRSERGGLLGWLLRTIPTAGVLALLGGIGYWGHHTEWTFSSQKPVTAAVPDWCERHGTVASTCVECNPELLPKPPTFGWCARHGVHDCPLDHPEVAQLAKPVRISPADFGRAEKALQLRKRAENDPNCGLRFRRIQFPSAESVEKAGITVETALASGVTEAIVASAEVGYDQTTVARLPARAAGTVREVLKTIGDSVRAGDVLAIVDATEVGKTKADFLQALVQLRQRRRALDDLKGVASMVPAQVREAEAAVREAEIRLLAAEQALANFGLHIRVHDFEKLSPGEAGLAMRLAGLPSSVTTGIDPKTATANLVSVVAARDGVVLERHVAAGEVVAAGKPLFVVGDVSRMWINLHVAPHDARLLAAGQQVRFHPDGTTGTYPAKLTWVGAMSDEKTRTVPARAEVANKDGEVRAGTFGIARVVLREEPDAITVPNEAVQFDGKCHLVFVRDRDFLKKDSPKVFHPRVVRVGAKDGANTEIIIGLLPNEIVAARGSGLLLKELQKNPLRAQDRKTR